MRSAKALLEEKIRATPLFGGEHFDRGIADEARTKWWIMSDDVEFVLPRILPASGLVKAIHAPSIRAWHLDQFRIGYGLVRRSIWVSAEKTLTWVRG